MSDILKGKWSKVEASSFKVINTGMDADMIVAVIIERVQGCNNTTCYMSFFFFWKHVCIRQQRMWTLYVPLIISSRDY